jgi:uncharacterized repeat protein (TIGR01451 family)
MRSCLVVSSGERQSGRTVDGTITKLAGVALAMIAIAAFGLSSTSASAADRTIELGAAGNFVVLAGPSIANTGSSVLAGSLGVAPGAAIAGFPPGLVDGATDADNAASVAGQSGLAAAYSAAEETTELPCETTVTGNLAGLTLTPGVYCAGAAVGITGTLTLNFEGDPNAFFLFRINGALTTAASSAVRVTNTGARKESCAPNTFWALNGAAGFGANTNFTGTVLANGGVAAGAGTIATGRLLANGAVTMNSSNVSACPNPIPPSASLSVAASGDPASVAPGAYILYPITATNAGPDGAAEASMTATLPIGLDFGAVSEPAGWSCTTPLLGFPGAVTCTAASFSTGVADFELTVEAYPGTAADTTLSLPVTISSPTGDPDESDLATSVDTQVLVPVVTPTTVTVAGPAPAGPLPGPVTSPFTPPVTITPAPTTKLNAACVSHRRFTVHLSKKQDSAHGIRITKAVLLNAKGLALKILKITSTSVDVDLRGLRGQRVTVRITTRIGQDTKTTSFSHSYETCSST